MVYEGTIASNKRRAKHSMCKTRVYAIWANMKSRCANTNGSSYHRYGGRGIKVCTSWLVFENFLHDMGHPADSLTLERIDNDGDYTPQDCKWVTRQKQANNRVTNSMITYQGKTQSIANWSRETGIAYHVIKHRRAIGWEPEKILSHDKFQGLNRKHTFMVDGVELTAKEYAKTKGISVRAVYNRLARK